MQGTQPKIWILVTDGERARIVVPDAAEGRFRVLLPLGTAEFPHCPPPLRDGPHHLNRIRFATEVAGRLNEEAENGAFDQLVLVAPGHTLAAVRDALSGTAAERVVGEVNRDCTKLPAEALSETLSKWWLAPPAQAAA